MASAEPFFECLGPRESYVFQGLTVASPEGEDFYDENVKFGGLQLMLPLMRLEKVADDMQVVEQNKRNGMIAK